MLKEQYDVTVTREKDDIVTYNPPMVVGVVHLDEYPSKEDIEKLIIDSRCGDSAFVTKTYKLI